MSDRSGDRDRGGDGRATDAGSERGPNEGGPGDGSNQSGGNGGSQDGGSSRESSGGQSGGGQGTSTAEKVVMVISALFALSLLAYGGWQMVTTPSAAAPNATVVETDTLPSGDVAVSVRLRNPGDVGLISATVEADCTTPPPSVQLTYVPASSTRQGTLVCPPGTTSPNVSVANWVKA